DLGFHADQISEELVSGLREAALTGDYEAETLCGVLKVDQPRLVELINHLQRDYRINREFSDQQKEQLGRIGFTLDEQATFVATALNAIGLTKNLAKFVLITGHGSFTENNPYESALDCGACGGNHGIVSARVLAQMANRPSVRDRVRKMGIEIPEDVCFIPALHNTTTDEVCLHDLDRVPPSHLFYLDWLRKGLAGASHRAAQERLPTLSPLKPETALEAFQEAQRNASDWSQVRPEWGLSRNCYFIIGRRDLTKNDSLDGRAFLHSYDYRVDPKRCLLESILTGPLVVGQWINMEHYFSAVDNEQFGSGSKVYHNVSGKFGVMSGNQSDLRTGLPAQTVLKDGKPYHEPVRLISVIEAPVEHALQAIDAVASVRNLVNNEWIRMMVLDPETSLIHVFEKGDWVERPFTENASETSEPQAV
ncbi:MAG: putative inorganic carbon transporter subunit DabA, partial [Rubripirellula sp.]